MKEKQIKRVIDAGITDIYLEEPEFWMRGGYSNAFKEEWMNYYGTPWQDQQGSPDVTYLSNKLKYWLYYRALDEIFSYAKEYGKSKGLEVKCYVPTHSLINYTSWQIVSPEAMETINNYYKQNPEEAKKEFGDNPYELKNILKYWVRSPKEGLQMIPTDSLVIKLDKEAIKRSGMLVPDSIPDYMSISLKGKRVLYKSELMMLEMLANTNWERPMYMAITVGADNHLNLTNNFLQEGLAYRITPFDNAKLGRRIDSEKMYDNLMNKFKFGGIDNPDIYLDETVLRMCDTHRRLFVQLASQLIKEGKKDKALKVLDYCEKVIPSTTVRHDYIYSSSKEMADNYIQLGQTQKAENILEQLANNSVEYAAWYLSLDNDRFAGSYEECMRHFYILDDVCKSLSNLKDAKTGKEPESAAHYAQKFEQLYQLLESRVGGTHQENK